MSPRDPKDLMEFPCHYQFKAVGPAGDQFYREVLEAVGRHSTLHDDAVRSRPSGKGNYQAVSLLVTLYNDRQLIDIYADLKQVTDLKMLL